MTGLHGSNATGSPDPLNDARQKILDFTQDLAQGQIRDYVLDNARDIAGLLGGAACVGRILGGTSSFTLLELLAALGIGALALATVTQNQETDDCFPNCIVRAGVAEPGSFIRGYGPVTVPSFEGLYGFSVQWEPGVSLQALASQGFRNNQISYARDSEVIAAGVALGYTLTITPTRPAYGQYHASVTAYESDGDMLTQLPADLDLALSVAFVRKIRNPDRT